MTLAALGLLIPLVTMLGGLVKWWLGYISDSSVLRRLQLSLERQKARMEVEAERLLRAYDRIETESTKEGEDLTDSLNDKFKSVHRDVAARARQRTRQRLRRLIPLLLLLAMTGCATFRPEPFLTFPDWPKIQFALVTGTGEQCLDQAEAQALDKWLDKLRAFEAARQRLLRGR